MKDFDEIVIQKGDSLYSLFGPDWKLVYNSDANKKFREQCPNPNAIKSGTPIYVPKKKYDSTIILYLNSICLDENIGKIKIISATDNISNIASEYYFESKQIIVICNYEIDRYVCRNLVKDNTYIFGCRNINNRLFMELYNFPEHKQEAVYLFGKNITNGDNITELSEYSLYLAKYPNCSFVQFSTNPRINSYTLSIDKELLTQAIIDFSKIL